MRHRWLYPGSPSQGHALSPPTWESGLRFQPHQGILADSRPPSTVSWAPGAPGAAGTEGPPAQLWQQRQGVPSCSGGQKPVIWVSAGPFQAAPPRVSKVPLPTRTGGPAIYQCDLILTNDICNDPIPQEGPIQRSWGLQLQRMWGDATHPVTLPSGSPRPFMSLSDKCQLLGPLVAGGVVPVRSGQVGYGRQQSWGARGGRRLAG